MMISDTYLYVIDYSDLNPKVAKIGISRTPKQRMQALSGSSPSNLNLVYLKKFETFEKAKEIESKWHHFFRDSRHRYELFKIDYKDIINAMEKEHGKTDFIPEDLNKIISDKKFLDDKKKETDYKFDLLTTKDKSKNYFTEDTKKLEKFSEMYRKENVSSIQKKLYDDNPSPLGGIFGDSAEAFSLQTEEIFNFWKSADQGMKNNFFSEFLEVYSDKNDWKLREIQKYYEDRYEELHEIGGGNLSKSKNCIKLWKEFEHNYPYAQATLACISILKEKHHFTFDDPRKRFQPPITFSLGYDERIGATVNFWILNQEWADNYESFKREIKIDKYPCTEETLMPICTLFDINGVTPFIHTLNKQSNNSEPPANLFKIDLKPGLYSFEDYYQTYYYGWGMKHTLALDYAEDTKKYKRDFRGTFIWEI